MSVEIDKETGLMTVKDNEEGVVVDGEGIGVGMGLAMNEESVADEDVIELECDRLGE